ncbi:hypothetical protein T4B_13111 [Trichinella pseudospiralis]|uniref:Uncharacterized protein n=1 Tax=Trichinella pseudospiralis TaxID=6337 RepID=A0A0V1J279_TRIPS|nr:hypothetical protein T4B_13111 [Trichinella pseudospiralis]
MPNWATKVALGWVATDVRLLCIATLKRLLGDPSSGGGFFERLSKKGANYDMFSVNSSLIYGWGVFYDWQSNNCRLLEQFAALNLDRRLGFFISSNRINFSF